MWEQNVPLREWDEVSLKFVVKKVSVMDKYLSPVFYSSVDP